MTGIQDAPPRHHRWPAWALPASVVAGPGAVGTGVGLAVARYRQEPQGLAIVLVVLLIAALGGAAAVSRAMRHERRRYAVTEIAVILAAALLFYAGSTMGRMVLAALVGGGLLATARTIRGERRQPTKMQNGWPSRSP
ncbi:hypothetical protein E1212_10525 [Jiangella ureilytica]|uniref:Uncharacterized protein n=1 Tax=Jiangella ureilytica TaxID=2530374 RepID=A0A4R4RQ58_9ACTN|nr:hypothetical protein [Jiangella ureilytica]TDC52031.1 hypothetical protein E1212_10525 [Jiangella ureilytica]